MTAIEQKQFNLVDYDDPMVERILNAAEQCIHRYGIRRTAMGEVARVGKLSRGSIYRHFGDKEALMEGVFRRRQLSFLNRTEAALEKESSLVNKVTLSVVQGREDMQQGIFAALAETEPETVAMMMADSRFFARSIEFWPPHLRMAQDSGEISDSVDIAFATDFIMRLAVSLVMHPKLGAKLDTQKQIRNYLQRAITSGLGNS
ncbi:MAG: AcrR family transcriptional regulator [Halioglobus sp.]|jgi:AcrR family transcriptional regulator